MAASRRIPIISALLFTTFTTALDLSVSGDPSVGEALTLSWDGESPFSLDILTAASSQGSFSLYRSFSPITVTNGVWNVDVAAGTLVEFEITDASGDSASQFVQIDDGGAALSSSSVASQSSESVASTQSLSSVLSESSVASVSSISDASTSSIAAATTTSTSDLSTSTDSNATPSQTVSQLPSVTSIAASSTATETSGTVVPPNQLNTSSGSKPGAVAGGVIGAILGLLLLLVIARMCYRRRMRARDDAQEAKIYPFMIDEALKSGTNGNGNNNDEEKVDAPTEHRRTLSRSKPDVVNWNPEQPHLTPAGPLPNGNGQEYFGNRNYRLSSSLGKFGELSANENTNALGMVLNSTTTPPAASAPTPTPPKPTKTTMMPTPPQPVMTTVANAAMPSVLDLARANNTKRASDLPLYNTASSRLSYNPTSLLQQPNFGRPSLESQNGTGNTKLSPFADKFAVEGKYEPDLEDPAVMASVASAQAPRPPRPARPEGLGLEEDNAKGASATESTMMTPPTMPAAVQRPQRNSFSNPGPVPTVGHSRKISNPIPVVSPRSPPVRARQQQSIDALPSWALVNSDGRYPAIIPTPTSVVSVGSSGGMTSPTGSMAGVGAGRVVSSQPGRQIYPAAVLPPSRQNSTKSLKGKRVSVAQSERSAAGMARAQSPPVRSPPPGAMRAMSPTARAQSPPVRQHKSSASVDAGVVSSPPPPRPPRASVPRAPKPEPKRQDSATPPIVTLPLTPPRRVWAEPDVPTTPSTPALSAFPTPPRRTQNVSGSDSSSSSPSSSAESQHRVKGSGASSVASRTSFSSSTLGGPVPTTAATSAYPDIEFNGPTPVTSPQVKGRALQPPPPISTSGLNPMSSTMMVRSAPNGLSPITASPQSSHHPRTASIHQQIPTPLASSTLGSPTLAQFGAAMLPGGTGIQRDNSVKTMYTMSSGTSELRRELMQGLPMSAPAGSMSQLTSPTTTLFPEQVSNYHPPVPQLPVALKSVPRPAVESWGVPPSLYDGSSAVNYGGFGKHVSIAPSYVSANSGRRLSEISTSGDAEWKELERQLAVGTTMNGGGDVAHIMPRTM